jgi:hypothetical protein
MDVEQAVSRLLALLDAHRGALTAAVAEADAELAQDQASATAAAHLLATESDYITGEETDGRKWFPFSFIMRVEVPDRTDGA